MVATPAVTPLAFLMSIALAPDPLATDPAPDSSATTTLLRFQSFIQSLQRKYVGVASQEAIDAVAVGIIAGENVFLGGKTGIGKTSIARDFASAVPQWAYRERLMHSGMSVKDLFGPVDPKTYTSGEGYRRLTRETLVDGDFIFLDELTDGPAGVNKALRGYLESGTVATGAGVDHCSPQVIIAAANELIATESLAERFGVSAWLETPLTASDDWQIVEREIHSAKENWWNPKDFKFTPGEISDLREFAAAMPFSEAAKKSALSMAAALRESGAWVSPRELKQMVKLMRAWSCLTGHESVVNEAVIALQWSWNTHAERQACEKAMFMILEAHEEENTDIDF